ncbi:hypothetical protein BHM03_00022113 [Ensete ventricosum]|nr:hypothetical protein BHM03_00022113 [Ensete ventricosum]
MAGRGRPPPPAVTHPADEPLLVRRAPVPSSILALEDRLAAQHRQIQVLLVDNQQLAVSHVALKQDLSASKHELRLAAASAAETKGAKDAEVREVYERSLKAEAEVRALEGMRAELAQVRSDVQSLGAVRHELVEQLQGLKGQLSSARAEHKQADTVMADIEIMRKEIQKGRTFSMRCVEIVVMLLPRSNFVVHEIIGTLGIDEDGDGLLLEETSNFHRLWVHVACKSMHHTIGRLWIFHRVLLVFVVLFTFRIINGFDQEKSSLLAAMVATPRLITMPT